MYIQTLTTVYFNINVQYLRFEVWGSHSVVIENSSLLRFCAMWNGWHRMPCWKTWYLPC